MKSPDEFTDLPDRAFTGHELAFYLHVDPNTVKRIPRDELPYIVVSTRGDRRYLPEDVAAFLRARRSS